MQDVALRHITLATDLTARSDRAFERAVSLADRWNAPLLIVHAVEERKRMTHQPSWRRGADAVQAARMKLQFEYPGWEGVDTSIHVKTGTPEDVVLEAASQAKTDLKGSG